LEVISMSTFLAVKALHEDGVAKKAIARGLGIDVRTVRKYIRRIERGEVEPRRAPVPRKLDDYGDAIAAKVEQGLSAVQVYQDLCEEPGFDASYETVKLEVRRLRRTDPEVYRRMRYRPGEEVQVDFGTLSRVPIGDRLCRIHLLVMTLCFSRYAYYEPVSDQRVPTFLAAVARPSRSPATDLLQAVVGMRQLREVGRPVRQARDRGNAGSGRSGSGKDRRGNDDR